MFCLFALGVIRKLNGLYDLKWQDKIIVYITKEITLPKFRRYRTRFRKVFYGSLRDYKIYLRDFMRKRKQ